MASVDVYVPCYNYARFLPDAVHSVLAQEGVAVRVLILDDASSDDSEAVGRALAATDPRVEYRRHTVNRGHLTTYNEGIDWLAGDYCLLLSADDMLVPGALSRAAAVMDAHPEVGLTYGLAIETEHPNSVGDRPLITPDVSINPGLSFIRSVCETAVNVVPTSTAIGRTSIQKAIGKYHSSLPHAGDLEMWLRFAALADVAFLQSHQAYYRRHPANMSRSYLGSRDLAQVIKAFEVFFEHWGVCLAEVDELRQLANRQALSDAFGGAYRAVERGDYLEYQAYSRLAVRFDPMARTRPPWLRLRTRSTAGRRVGRWLQSLWRSLLASRPLSAKIHPACTKVTGCISDDQSD